MRKSREKESMNRNSVRKNRRKGNKKTIDKTSKIESNKNRID